MVSIVEGILHSIPVFHPRQSTYSLVRSSQGAEVSNGGLQVKNERIRSERLSEKVG